MSLTALNDEAANVEVFDDMEDQWVEEVPALREVHTNDDGSRPAREKSVCIRVHRETRDALRELSRIEEDTIQNIVREALHARSENPNLRRERELTKRGAKAVREELDSTIKEYRKLANARFTETMELDTIKRSLWFRIGQFLGLIPQPQDTMRPYPHD